MSIDLTKVILETSYNSFKNANIYRGTITLPSTVPPATPAVPFSQTSTSFGLTVSPVFTTFWALFNEAADGLNNINNPQWYNASLAGASGISYPVLKDPVFGNLGCSLYPIINGTSVTIIAQVQNQTAHTFSATITVPFTFVDFTLVN